MGHATLWEMKIALVHSFYRDASHSGENEVVVSQRDLLENGGHDVRVFGFNTGNGLSQLDTLRAVGRVATERGRNPLSDLEEYQPDIVHVHNLFPNYGASWLRHVSAPVIVTLHNFRLWCASGNFTRDAKPCFDCAKGSSISGVINRCYRGSALASAPLAIANSRPVAKRPLVEHADAVVTL